ncbi:MAG: DUF4142 domain-containing protein [Candidatus Tyrphobacter sp.]
MIALAFAATLAASDAQFVRDAMRIGNEELSRAHIAANATDVRQREYAQRISTDIGAANIELISIARQYRVMLDVLPSPAAGAPSTPQPPQRANVAKMRILSTTLTPARYFQLESANLRSAIALYARESRSTDRATLRSFSMKMLTTLRSDLKLAQRDAHEGNSR